MWVPEEKALSVWFAQSGGKKREDDNNAIALIKANARP
jgi:hypothetical protein